MNPKLLTSASLSRSERLIPLLSFAGGAFLMFLAAACNLLNGLTVLLPTQHLLLFSLARILLPSGIVLLLGRSATGIITIPALCAACGAMLSGEASVLAMEQGGQAFLCYCQTLGITDIAASLLLLPLSALTFSRTKKRFPHLSPSDTQSLSFKGGEAHVCASQRI